MRYVDFKLTNGFDIKVVISLEEEAILEMIRDKKKLNERQAEIARHLLLKDLVQRDKNSPSGFTCKSTNAPNS